MKFKYCLKTFLLVIVFFLVSGLCAFSGMISTEAKLEYNKGVDYYQLGQYTQAAESFKNATRLDPNYIDAYYNLGALLEYLKQDDEALSAFKQIILRKPEDYEAVYKAAEISFRLGNPDKAKMYLTLIPKDSLIGQRAKQLETRMDNPEVVSAGAGEGPNNDNNAEVQNNLPEQLATFDSMNDNNGIFSNIESPTGVVADNEGNLYVASFSENTIYKIGNDNNKVVYIKSAKIDGPIGLVRDVEGNFYVANYNRDNVLKIDASGQVTELITNIKNPYCMYISNGLLFVSSQGSNSVIRYKLGM